MKIDDIEAFVAMVRCQSISLAAQELGLTQPAITRRLQNLEESLGTPLLDRHTKPPKPNELGWRVHAQCQTVLREIDALHELAAADLPPTGSIRLGLTQGIGEVVALKAHDFLRKKWPELTPLLATGPGANVLLERVERNEIDAAVLFLPRGALLHKNLQGIKLLESSLVVVGRKGDWPGKRYSLAECNEHGWILNPDGCGFRAGLKRALAAKNLPLRVNLDSYGRDLQFQSVAQGLGPGLSPLPMLESSSLRERLQIIPVPDFKPLIDLWLVTGKPLGRLEGPVKTFGECVAQLIAGKPH